MSNEKIKAADVDLNKVFSDFRLAGIKIDMDALDELEDRVESTISKMQFNIVDKGYVDSLNNSDFAREFIASIVDEFPDEKDLLFSAVDGSILFKPETAFVARKYAKEQDFRDLLEILYQLWYSTELSEEIKSFKKFIDRNNVFKPDIFYVSNNIKNKECNFVNKKEFLQIIDGDNYGTVFIRGMMYFNFLLSIGVPRAELIQFKLKNKGVLLKKLTYREECDICNYIMQFHIECDTDYKKYYNAERQKFFNPKTRKSDKELYVYEYLRDIKKIIASIEGNEVEPAMITQYRLLFKMNTPTISKSLFDMIGQPQIIKKSVKRIWENSGLYVFNWETEQELDKCNALMGYTGEFISCETINKMSAKDKKIEAIAKSVKPIKLIELRRDNGKMVVEYINMYRIDDFGFPFKVDYSNIVFEYSDLDVIFSKFKVTNAQDLFKCIMRELYTMFKEELSEKDEYFVSVVADIVMTLIYTDCALVHESFIPLDSRIEKLYKDKYKLFLEATLIAQEYTERRKVYN